MVKSHSPSLAQLKAWRKNIKKAQRKWDKMHHSRAEGYIPKKYWSNGEMFWYVNDYPSEKSANKKARKMRLEGWKVRTDELKISGKIRHIVYKGKKRKRNAPKVLHKRWYR